MSGRNYINLSRHECLSEYKIVLKKSEECMKSAEILADNNHYDNATSLLIISNEELIKSFVLFIDGNGFNFRQVPGMKSMFQNHKLRYLFSMVLHLISIVGEDLSKKIMEIKNDSNFLEGYIKNSNEAFEEFRTYLLNNLSKFRSEIEFFSKVDKVRQIGFYSELDQSVTKDQYELFHFKIVRLKQMIAFLTLAFYDPNMTEIIKKQIKDFSSRNYGKLSELLGRILKPEINSYTDLLKTIDEIENALRQ